MNKFPLSSIVNTYLPLGLVLLALYPLAVPYLQDGYQVAHDRLVPFMRVWSLRQAITWGQFPPRWFSDFDGGYGSPYPSFYGMLFYYGAVAISMFSGDIGAALEITAFLTMALAAIGMYFLVKQLWGIPSGILAAVSYSFAPYHLVDAFVRGAYSELTAFVWFPIILLGISGWVSKLQRRWLILSALSIAGLLLSHNLMPVMFLPFALFFPLLFMRDAGLGPNEMKKCLIGLVWSGLLALLISAFFWVPILLERGYVRLDYFMEFDYRSNFVSLPELLSTVHEHVLTKTAGNLHFIGMVAALIAAVLNKRLEFKVTIVGASIASLICLYMTVQASDWIWNTLPFMSFIQFPWRFLSPAVFFLSLAVSALPAFFNNTWMKWAITLCLSLAIMVLSQPLVNIPDHVDTIPLNAQFVCKEVWGTQDYRPSWSKTLFWSGTFPPADPVEDPLILSPCPNDWPLMDSKAVNLQTIKKLGTHWDIALTADQSTALVIPQFYYPGWRARLDDQLTSIEPFGDNGLMQVNLPAGQHRLQIDFIETPVRNMANLLTIVGLLVLATLFGKGIRSSGIWFL